jgi:hypothetical protein
MVGGPPVMDGAFMEGGAISWATWGATRDGGRVMDGAATVMRSEESSWASSAWPSFGDHAPTWARG